MSENKIINKNMLRKRKEKSIDITDEIFNTFNEHNKWLYNEYFDNNRHLSPETIIQYKSGINYFLYFILTKLNNKNFYEISKRDFLKYINHLIELNYSSSGISAKKAAVSSLNNFIENYLDDVPEYKNFRSFSKTTIKIPKNKVYDKVAISKSEYEKLLEAMKEEDNKLALTWLAVAFNSLGRRAEIIQLKTNVINPMENNLNYVTSGNIRGKGRGKDGKSITLMLNSEAMKYIRELLESRDFEGDYVFMHKRNGVPKVVSKGWVNDLAENKWTKILGRRVHPHLFRASGATYLLESNKDINAVSKFVLNHENVATTQLYDLRKNDEAKNTLFEEEK